MTQMSFCGSSSLSDDASNPLLQLDDWGVAEGTPFGIVPFESIKPQHYVAAFERAFESQRNNVKRILESDFEPSFATVVVPLDRADIRLASLKDLFEMSEAAVSDSLFRAVSADLWPKISAAQDEVWMNEELFLKVDAVYQNRAKEGLTKEQLRLLERFQTRFVRAGVMHSAEHKGRLAQINSEIAMLNSQFATNLLAANESFILDLGSADLDGLPNDVRSAAKDEAARRGLKGRWVFTLNPSSMIPFLTFSENRGLRESIYKAYAARGYNSYNNSGADDNQAIVAKVTKLRQERAKILGYESHADYVISQQMASSPKAAYDLLEQILKPATALMEHEQDLIFSKIYVDDAARRYDALRLGLGEGEEPHMEPWDWWYCMEQYRKDEFSAGGDIMRPFFTVENVRRGAFQLANRLYGVVFRPITAPIYDPHVLAYEVLDRDNSHLGVLYLDLYSRSGKGQGAWCGNLREQGYRSATQKITPVVAMVCNFSAPIDNVATQLTLEQVETYFHEFGHAMHFLFQDVEYRGLRGVEGDFVEFPSQLMENWAFEPELLKMYAVHCRTTRIITDDIIENLHKSLRLGRGFDSVRQTAAALLDLDLHSMTEYLPLDDLSSEGGVKSFEISAVREKYGLDRSVDPKYWLGHFPHLYLYDYSAGYYFYQWAEVLDKDTFAQFKMSYEGVFSRSLATKLRHEILSRGGEADGMTLYRNFRGVDPSRAALIQSLSVDKK
ncbi:MAG: M3 family metallopeptidase [Rikenellaceae bacterium]